MEIANQRIGEVDVVYLSGRLDTYTASEVEKKLIPLTEKTPVQLVLSLKDLEYISSAGLRVLLVAQKNARLREGEIRFAGVPSSVKGIFDLSGFSRLFKMFDHEEEAIGSFQGA